MGNSQSANDKESSHNNVESQVDARLRRFHTGAADTPSSNSSSSTLSPHLRRTSTTATGTATEERSASTGRGRASLQQRVSNAGGVGGDGRKAGTISATGSPRATDQERAWVRSVGRTTTASAAEGSLSPTRTRSRSGSIGHLMGGAGGVGGSSSSGRQRGATLHEDQVFDPHSQNPDLSRRAELTFRRNPGVHLGDIASLREGTSSGPATPSGLSSLHAAEDPRRLVTRSKFAANNRLAAGLSSDLNDTDSDQIASPISGQDSVDTYNPLFPIVDAQSTQRDPLGRSQPAAFPSYLKIPTLIPSTYASPTSSIPSSPLGGDFKNLPEGDQTPNAATTAQSSNFPAKLGAGGTAAAAILNTEDVVIKPGGASKASTPSEERSPLDAEERGAEAMHIQQSGGTSLDGRDVESNTSTDEGSNSGPSRTPTPTPGNLRGAQAMTPTGQMPAAMSALRAAGDDGQGEDRSIAGAIRRAGLQMYTGMDSGPNTPGLANLPIGLTSTPFLSQTPRDISTYNAEQQEQAGLTNVNNNLKNTLPPLQIPSHADAVAPPAKTATLPSTQGTVGAAATRPPASAAGAGFQVPLMPIVVKWRGGGKEVFVTGTFANEWRSKILLKKTGGSGKRTEYSCMLHLAPGTHRLKFIVDDRWRVSRDLSTASDGEGNLTNYIEVAHTGPAHPGPLSAPGQDLLVGEEEEEKRKRVITKDTSGIAAHKATFDLIEEARRAEALRRGDLLDVFGEDKVRKEERWTQEIPEAIVKAQAAEEAYRNELEQQPSRKDGHPPFPNIPAPPSLPRQLEKVILNSSPAIVAGAVDDNSVLPAPNHAVLHHLTASAIKSGVIATGCTMRYRKKYITTIYYRAAK